MRRVCQASVQPLLSRGISGVSPTLYLRPLRAAAKAEVTDPALLRTKLSALCRFAKAQLPSAADEETKAAIKADIARYEKYINSVDAYVADITSEVQQQVSLMHKLDRYPEVSISRVQDFADILEKKTKAAIGVLEQQPKQDFTVDPEYWATSKFRVLAIKEGSVALLDDGDVPPGAIELLPGQIIETRVDGSEVYIEVENVKEGKMMLWFKPDVAVPKGAEVMWSYAYDPLGEKKAGTKWLTQENVVVASKPGEVVVAEDAEPGDWAVETLKTSEPEAPKYPGPTPQLDLYKPLADKIKVRNSPETQVAFRKALLDYGEHFNLEAEYASHYDREVVEAKRDRVLSTLSAAADAPLPAVNPVALSVNFAVYKGLLIDSLRTAEAHIGELQLQARLHERRLQGEPITAEEEIEYTPHVRDDAELERDYNPMFWGRYIWQLFPHTDSDPDCVIQDVRFRDLPAPVNSLAVALAKQEKATPAHKKAERAITAGLYAYLALKQKEADQAAGKLWPGQE